MGPANQQHYEGYAARRLTLDVFPPAGAPHAPEHLLDGRYVIERELGRGGMGAVYLARDARLDRPVAIKVLPAEYAVVPTLRERFLRESRLAAGFSHPNIVPVYAVEESDELLAYVMAFVEGETVAERVQRAGPLSVRETLRVLQDVAYALAFAHGRGVVHRDIKPDNIMIERATGRALVMDFGIARPISAAPAAPEGLTRVGEIVGTPEFMSPEQATGDRVDGRSDLYSLGLVVHYALTGSAVMSAVSTGKILARQLTEIVPPVRSTRPDVPAALGDAIDRCLAKDPADRFADAASLVATLDAARLGEPEIPVGIRLLAQSLGTLSLVVVAGLLFLYVITNVQRKSGTTTLDSLLPLVLMLGVFGARALQVLSEARQLALGGFSADAINRGLHAVMAERAARREELKADERVRRARRRSIWIGATLVVVAPIMVRAAFALRVQTAPARYQTPLVGVALIFGALILFPVGMVTLGRSPLKMPLGERLFRLVWIGPVGRWLIGRACRGTPVAEAAVSAPRAMSVSAMPRTEAPVVAPAHALPTSRISALEARIAALERWRENLS